MDKVLFHHIPKTAGSSLIERVQALFGDAVCPGRYDDQVSDADILAKRFVFYHGHFTRGFVLRFRSLVPDAMIFTFVRHPFDRTLSQYFNWTDRARVERELMVIAQSFGESEHLRRLRDKFASKILDMSLERFLASRDPDILQASDNLQSQYMTLVERKPNHRRFNVAAVNAVGFYDFIGLKELLEPCLRIVEAKWGLEAGALGSPARSNTSDYARTDGRYRVTAREMVLLERRNIYDLALFHVCHTLLLKQYADFLPAEAGDLESLVTMPEIIRRRPSGAKPAGRPGMPALDIVAA